MLNRLYIKNFILIPELEIEFKEGLTVITGETGAGKSLLLGAIQVLIGEKTDKYIQLKEGEKCIIEANFNISKISELKEFLNLNDIDYSENSLVRKEIYPNKKNRTFINDCLVNGATLKEFTYYLIDIHSQFQSTKLKDKKFRNQLIDSFCIDYKELETYHTKFNRFKKVEQEIRSYQVLINKQKREKEFNEFLLNEIITANLKENEDVIIEEKLAILSNSDKIVTILTESMYELSEKDESVLTVLNFIKKKIQSVSNFGDKLLNIDIQLSECIEKLKDIQFEVSDAINAINSNPEELALLEERYTLIQNLIKKNHTNSLIGLIEYANELKKELLSNYESETTMQNLQNEYDTLHKELSAFALKFSDSRKKTSSKISKELVSYCSRLEMENAQVVIDVKTDTQTLTEFGYDTIQILFSANKGKSLENIQDIASGGELSRFMLAYKYLLSGSRKLPSIIFDEVDSGISGESAIKVGKLIKELSHNCQTLIITHLPQVAAMGNHHLKVSKQVTVNNTQTQVSYLNQGERIKEIAEMIGGKSGNDINLSNAQSLIERFA